jgi:hypothetical protein
MEKRMNIEALLQSALEPTWTQKFQSKNYNILKEETAACEATVSLGFVKQPATCLRR